MSPSRVPLGDIADFVNGVAFKPDDWEESGKRIIRIQNLTDSRKPFNRTNRAVAKKYEAAPGDLLVSWSATLGVFVWEGPDTALVNQHIFRVVPDHGRIDLRYLKHMLSDALIQMEQHLHGATMKHVNRGEFLGTTIPLPPVTEQKRIARVLDAADALRTKRREAFAQLDTLLQSTFLDMFGDPVSNPMGWEEHEVEKVCRIVRGSSPRPKGDPQFYGGPVPRLMVSDITRDGFWVTPRIDSLTEAGAKKSRNVPAGTVVMAVSGEVGVVATVQVPCCVHDGFVAFLDLDESVFGSHFFMFQFHLLKMTHERRKAGAIFQNLTTRDIKAMRLPTPTTDLQHQFAAIVESVEHQKARQRAHLAELDTLFASLQSRAFRGDL